MNVHVPVGVHPVNHVSSELSPRHKETPFFAVLTSSESPVVVSPPLKQPNAHIFTPSLNSINENCVFSPRMDFESRPKLEQTMTEEITIEVSRLNLSDSEESKK